MIVFDIEATSLDQEKGAMTSLGAVDFNNPQRTWYKEFRIWEGAKVDDEALEVSGFTREQITDPDKPLFEEVCNEFLEWIKGCSSNIFAGQNVMFDIGYLDNEIQRADHGWPSGHRSVDLHAVAFCKRWQEGGKEPIREDGHSQMNLGEISQSVGINFHRGHHNALEDAKLTAECFSRLLFNKKLFKEFDQ